MSTRVIIPGEDEGAQHAGGIHKRPPIPDNSLKAECPKFMSHGPCGGVRKGGSCEVYPEMACPWVTLYIQLEKIGQVEWMKQVKKDVRVRGEAQGEKDSVGDTAGL